MKLVPGVEVIETSFFERPLNMVLFRGRDVALVDTGLVGTPTDAVIPYLDAVGLTPHDLAWIIVTHAHADHFGGNEEMWLASGENVRFAAHRLDQAWIEDPPAETRRAKSKRGGSAETGRKRAKTASRKSKDSARKPKAAVTETGNRRKKKMPPAAPKRSSSAAWRTIAAKQKRRA